MDCDECEFFDSIVMLLGYYKMVVFLEIWIECYYLICVSNVDVVQVIIN